MRLEQLKYIVEIADAGSFTTASERLFIAQPSISQSVAALEKELNITIFKRSRLGTVPTERGEQVIACARLALEQVQKIENLKTSDYYEIHDTITVSTIPILLATILPHTIEQYKKLFPNVAIKLSEHGTKTVRQDIQKNVARIGLVSRHSDTIYNDDEKFTPLFTGHLMAYVNKNHALATRREVSYQEIVRHPLVMFGDGYSLNDYLLKRLREFGEPNVITTSQNPDSIIRLVNNLDAVGFSPDISIVSNIYVTSGEIVPLVITDEHEETEFGILTNNKNHMSIAEENFIKQILLEADHFQRVHMLALNH